MIWGRGPVRLAVIICSALVPLASLSLPAAALTSSPNDPYFPQQWALSGAPGSINAPSAWCVTDGAGVLIGDIDTGADPDQPDLAGKVVLGARFVSGSPGSAADDNGHGTMTAGIMAADTNNGTGIAAVAPGARILAVKVLDTDGSGSDTDVASGIRWATDNGARVINLSLGPDVPLLGTALTSGVPSAIQYAASHNVAVAVAAGNGGLPLSSFQGIETVALVVGALDRDGQPSSYSNSSIGVNIWAPGGESATNSNGIVSTVPGGGYRAAAGTSFAAPHVAGVLALLMSQGYSAAAARQRILATASGKGGFPEVNAAAASGSTGTCAGAPGGGNGSALSPSSVAAAAAAAAAAHRGKAVVGPSSTPLLVPTDTPLPVPTPTPTPTPLSALTASNPRNTPTATNATAKTTGGQAVPALIIAGASVVLLVSAAVAASRFYKLRQAGKAAANPPPAA